MAIQLSLSYRSAEQSKCICKSRHGIAVAKKWTKVHQNAVAPVTRTNAPYHAIALGQTVYEKNITILNAFHYFGATGGPGPKFTTLGGDV